MKLTSNIGTASSSRATSSAPAHPTQAEDTVTPPQTRSPPGLLAGLSSGPVLRGRRAPLSRRVTAGTTQAESSHGASQRSESSQSSHSSELTDASFHTAQASPTSSVVDEPQAPAAATTHAQRSASAAAELKAQLRARLVDLPFAAPRRSRRHCRPHIWNGRTRACRNVSRRSGRMPDTRSPAT